MELKRVLLKLSGEALAGDKKTGFDEATVKEVARQVKTAVDDGIEVGIVIGGGNFWRGRQSNAIDRTKADQIGMLATVGSGCVSSHPVMNTPTTLLPASSMTLVDASTVLLTCSGVRSIVHTASRTGSL